MLKLLLRLFFLCFGALLVLDALLPTTTQTLTIERHSVHSSSKGRGDSYYIEFNNYRVSSCSVSRERYHALQNGDEVVVKSTTLLKHCVRIEKDGVVLSNKGIWRLLGILLGAGFIAYGIGWIKPETWWPKR
jgi:hypothetical protein